MLTEFIWLADSIGQPTEADGRPTSDLGLRHARAAANGISGYDGPALAVAQHSGLPTRLLDWTFNPYCALYFAASDVDSRNAQDRPNMSVWALQISEVEEKLSERSPDPRVEMYPPLNADNPYQRAQLGCFTVVRHAERWFLENGKWPSVEEVIRQTLGENKPDVLRRYDIDQRLYSEIIAHLWRLGVSRAYLMPSLENVSKSLNEKWQLEASAEPVTTSTGLSDEN